MDVDLTTQIERISLHICDSHFNEDQVIRISSNTIFLVYHAYLIIDWEKGFFQFADFISLSY